MLTKSFETLINKEFTFKLKNNQYQIYKDHILVASVLKDQQYGLLILEHRLISDELFNILTHYSKTPLEKRLLKNINDKDISIIDYNLYLKLTHQKNLPILKIEKIYNGYEIWTSYWDGEKEYFLSVGLLDGYSLIYKDNNKDQVKTMIKSIHDNKDINIEIINKNIDYFGKIYQLNGQTNG